MSHRIKTVALAAAALLLLATPTLADKDPNAETVVTILDALLQHNPFTARDPKSNSTFAELAVGPYHFQVMVVNDEKDKLLNCAFTHSELDADGKEKESTATTYYDFGCIGPLHKVSIGETAPKSPTADDQLAYRGFLRFLSKLVPTMQEYVPDVSVPSDFTLGLDFALRARNRALLETILHQMEQTSVTDNEKNRRTILISGTNKMFITLAADISGDHYENCLLGTRSLQGDIAFIDETCSGSVRHYIQGEEEHEVNVWDVAPRLNKALTALERFTSLLSAQFPKK